MANKNSKNNNKDFVWIGLRISFWVMVLIWVGEMVFLSDELSAEGYWTGFMAIISLLFVVSGVFTFVVSIVHLVKHKKKAFAITSLVISSILVLLFVVGLIVGAIEDLNYSESDLEEYVDFSCQNFCTGLENVESYNYEYDETTDSVICYCFDINEDIINQKTIPLE
jgi:hypothetical protein